LVLVFPVGSVFASRERDRLLSQMTNDAATVVVGRRVVQGLAPPVADRVNDSEIRTSGSMNRRRAFIAAAAATLIVVAGSTAIAVANGVLSLESNRIGVLVPDRPRCPEIREFGRSAPHRPRWTTTTSTRPTRSTTVGETTAH
jgi:hypothetical protein